MDDDEDKRSIPELIDAYKRQIDGQMPGYTNRYTLIPNFLWKIMPESILKKMYSKVMERAVVEYGTPLMMCGEALDSKEAMHNTVLVEKEIIRRKLEKKPLNPDSPEGPKVYATEVWADLEERVTG